MKKKLQVLGINFIKRSFDVSTNYLEKKKLGITFGYKINKSNSQITPGPGAYEIKEIINKTGIKMSKSMRSGISINLLGPGPG